MLTMEGWTNSDETGEPFSHCIRCRLPLLEIASQWLVNKEYAQEECVMEYAVCQPCRDAVTAELSEESKESVRYFLEHEIDWEERIKEFMLFYDPTGRFDACISCQVPRQKLPEFGISALFDSGGTLVTGPLPLLICKTCIGRMTAGMSEKSLEVWRRFLSENFAGPPAEGGFPGLF